MKRRGEGRHLALFLILSETCGVYQCDIAVRAFFGGFVFRYYQLNKFTVFLVYLWFLKIMDKCEILSSVFSASIEMIM
jgi:hypothetical protein